MDFFKDVTSPKIYGNELFDHYKDTRTPPSQRPAVDAHRPVALACHSGLVAVQGPPRASHAHRSVSRHTQTTRNQPQLRRPYKARTSVTDIFLSQLRG